MRYINLENSILIMFSMSAGDQKYFRMEMELRKRYKMYKQGINQVDFIQELIKGYFNGEKECIPTIYEFLKLIARDVNTLDVNVIEFLNSEKYLIRKAARRFIYLFWHIYEHDEEVVHLISRFRMFVRLLSENTKYSQFYAKRIAKWNAKMKPKKREEEPNQGKPKYLESIEIKELLKDVNSLPSLIEKLRKAAESANCYEQLIIGHFIEQFGDVSSTRNTELLVDVCGLKGSQLYREMELFIAKLSKKQRQ